MMMLQSAVSVAAIVLVIAQIRDGVLVPGLRALEERFRTAGQAPGPVT
jgi:hypothetical protein